MEKKILMFVYGSLRKGFYNNVLLKDSKLLGKAKLKGYKMYSRGLFPVVVNGSGEITGEVYQIEDKEVFREIHQMESRAGYRAVDDVVTINRERYKVILYRYNYRTSYLPEIESGDWEEFKKGV